jgi:hypothetical protein
MKAKDTVTKKEKKPKKEKSEIEDNIELLLD